MRSCVDHRLPSNTCLSRGHHKNLSKVGLSRYGGRASASRVKATSDDELYPPKLRKLMDSFNLVPDPMLRYKQLLFLAKKLPPFPKDKLLNTNKVPGCTSQVWISVDVIDDKAIILADSDSQLTKGLAALIVEGLSGESTQHILDVPPGFISSFGLNQSLTPSRTSGFLNMLQLVKDKVKAGGDS